MNTNSINIPITSDCQTEHSTSSYVEASEFAAPSPSSCKIEAQLMEVRNNISKLDCRVKEYERTFEHSTGANPELDKIRLDLSVRVSELSETLDDIRVKNSHPFYNQLKRILYANLDHQEHRIQRSVKRQSGLDRSCSVIEARRDVSCIENDVHNLANHIYQTLVMYLPKPIMISPNSSRNNAYGSSSINNNNSSSNNNSSNNNNSSCNNNSSNNNSSGSNNDSSSNNNSSSNNSVYNNVYNNYNNCTNNEDISNISLLDSLPPCTLSILFSKATSWINAINQISLTLDDVDFKTAQQMERKPILERGEGNAAGDNVEETAAPSGLHRIKTELGCRKRMVFAKLDMLETLIITYGLVAKHNNDDKCNDNTLNRFCNNSRESLWWMLNEAVFQ